MLSDRNEALQILLNKRPSVEDVNRLYYSLFSVRVNSTDIREMFEYNGITFNYGETHCKATLKSNCPSDSFYNIMLIQLTQDTIYEDGLLKQTAVYGLIDPFSKRYHSFTGYAYRKA